MTANTSNPLTLPGVDFNGLPVTVEILTSPANGTLVPNGAEFTYTPNADFCGIDSVTYRVNNGTQTSHPLTVMLPVGPYIEPAHSGTTILQDNFDDENFDGWTASEKFKVIHSTSGGKGTVSWIDAFPQPYEGTAGVGTPDGSGTLEQAIDTTAFENLRLILQVATGNFRAGTGEVSAPDKAKVQWYDGSTWHDLLLHGHTYATNRLFSNYDISLPAGAADNPDFRLRLTTTSSDGYFDSIHLSGDQLPVAPVAYDASYQLEMNQPLPLTLEASDLNNDPLTFQIVDGPNNGSLSGSGDQRTYTPHNNFTGVDTFTFKANDGGLDSNIATVTITVRDNSAPVVNAGPDQTVSILPENLPQPGLWFGEVSGNINATDPNPETTLLVDVASRTEDGITDGITEIFTGQIYDADGVISFTEVIDEKVRIWVNGTLVLSDDNFISRTYSGTLNEPPGWNDLEVRISSGGGGSGPRSTSGIGFNPTGSATWDGGSNWQTLSDPGDGSFLRVTGAGQTISLSSAIVTDPDNDSLNVTWSQISGPSISFDDPNLANTTAFVEAFGVYTLRLTVDDGLVQVYDELTITVTGPLTEMEQFLVDNGLPHDTDMNFDSDGDGQTNLQEFLVMTNPNDPDSTLSIAFNSSGNLHSPISMVAGRFYRICWKATLIGGNWVAVPGYEGTTPSDGSPMSISVDTSGFYRMEVSDQPFAN